MKLIDTLENNNLVSAELIVDEISTLPFKRIEVLRHEIEQAVLADMPDQPSDSFDAFSFLASSSFRGESGCAHWECRRKKAEVLARYAALFCDRIVLPFSFHSAAHEASQREQRHDLITALQLLAGFRPLIDSKVILLAPADVHYCPQHFASEVPGGKRILALQTELTEKLYNKFKMTYDPSVRGGAITVDGPEDYLEHGHMAWTLKPDRRWLGNPAYLKKARRLTPKEVRSSGIVDRLIGKMAMDVAVQQVYGLRFGCSYLTDRAGEASFLTGISEEDALAARTAVLCSELSHTVPLFSEVPLERVMSIRRDDYTAFASYRAAMSKIVAENVCDGKELTLHQARELYRDVLEPELLGLEQQARNERASSLRNSGLKVALVTGVVALGAYTGIVPAHLSELYKAMGGAALLNGLAEVLSSLAKNPGKIRSHNLYFLLRLKQEHDRL